MTSNYIKLLPYFDTSNADVYVREDMTYTSIMKDTNKLAIDDLTVKHVAIGDYNFYDIEFLQTSSGSAKVVSSVRLTELQVGLLSRKVLSELTDHTEYPNDVLRNADKEIEKNVKKAI